MFRFALISVSMVWQVSYAVVGCCQVDHYLVGRGVQGHMLKYNPVFPDLFRCSHTQLEWSTGPLGGQRGLIIVQCWIFLLHLSGDHFQWHLPFLLQTGTHQNFAENLSIFYGEKSRRTRCHFPLYFFAAFFTFLSPCIRRIQFSSESERSVGKLFRKRSPLTLPSSQTWLEKNPKNFSKTVLKLCLQSNRYILGLHLESRNIPSFTVQASSHRLCNHQLLESQRACMHVSVVVLRMMAVVKLQLLWNDGWRALEAADATT